MDVKFEDREGKLNQKNKKMNDFEKLREIIQERKAKDLVGKDFKLIDISSEDNVLTALRRLLENNISSLPVLDAETKSYKSSVDLQDIMSVVFVLSLVKLLEEVLGAEFGQEKKPSHKEDYEFNMFASQKVKDFCSENLFFFFSFFGEN